MPGQQLPKTLIDVLEQEQGHAILVVAEDGSLRWCNTAAEAVLGRSRSDALGKPVAGLFGNHGRHAPRSDVLATLTDRQREILLLIGEGHSSPEIARHLGRSVKTIEAHRSHIMKRVGVHNLAGLIRFAILSSNHPTTGR